MNRNDWNERYRTAELVWTAEPDRFLVAEVADLPPGRALDVAAGEGRNAVWLAEQGWSATAADFSDVAMAKARDLAGTRGVAIETMVADATEPLPGAPEFDLVVVAYLQLPEPDRSAALRNAARAVAPGGTLLVIAHDESNLVGGYGGPPGPRRSHEPGRRGGRTRGLRDREGRTGGARGEHRRWPAGGLRPRRPGWPPDLMVRGNNTPRGIVDATRRTTWTSTRT